MNGQQMTMSFVETRARRNDSDTSKTAAKNAASGKAARQRVEIYECLRRCKSGTAMEIAVLTCLGYITVQRRISEVAGIHKTDEIRDSCRVWAIGHAPCFFSDSGDRDRKAMES